MFALSPVCVTFFSKSSVRRRLSRLTCQLLPSSSYLMESIPLHSRLFLLPQPFFCFFLRRQFVFPTTSMAYSDRPLPPSESWTPFFQHVIQLFLRPTLSFARFLSPATSKDKLSGLFVLLFPFLFHSFRPHQRMFFFFCTPSSSSLGNIERNPFLDPLLSAVDVSTMTCKPLLSCSFRFSLFCPR